MPESQIALDPAPVRSDMSSRECVAVLSGTIGGLLNMAPDENVQRALDYLAKHLHQLAPSIRDHVAGVNRARA